MAYTYSTLPVCRFFNHTGIIAYWMYQNLLFFRFVLLWTEMPKEICFWIINQGVVYAFHACSKRICLINTTHTHTHTHIYEIKLINSHSFLHSRTRTALWIQISLAGLKFKNTFNLTDMEIWKMQQLNDFYLCNQLQESVVLLSGKL